MIETAVGHDNTVTGYIAVDTHTHVRDHWPGVYTKDCKILGPSRLCL